MTGPHGGRGASATPRIPDRTPDQSSHHLDRPPDLSPDRPPPGPLDSVHSVPSVPKDGSNEPEDGIERLILALADGLAHHEDLVRLTLTGPSGVTEHTLREAADAIAESAGEGAGLILIVDARARDGLHLHGVGAGQPSHWWVEKWCTLTGGTAKCQRAGTVTGHEPVTRRANLERIFGYDLKPSRALAGRSVASRGLARGSLVDIWERALRGCPAAAQVHTPVLAPPTRPSSPRADPVSPTGPLHHRGGQSGLCPWCERPLPPRSEKRDGSPRVRARRRDARFCSRSCSKSASRARRSHDSKASQSASAASAPIGDPTPAFAVGDVVELVGSVPGLFPLKVVGLGPEVGTFVCRSALGDAVWETHDLIPGGSRGSLK